MRDTNFSGHAEPGKLEALAVRAARTLVVDVATAVTLTILWAGAVFSFVAL